MSDYGRYGDFTRDRGRERDRWSEDRHSSGRTRDSMFGSDWAEPEPGWGGRSAEQERGGGFGGRGRGEERSWRSNQDRDRSRGWGDDRRGERNFGSDDYREGIAIEETSRLIASNKVEGTAVYGRDGERLGSIYNFMVDKRAGKVEYAVMSYGGFMGLGTRYYPVPWRMLTYDTRMGGYVVDMTERDLERAPSFDRNSEPTFDRQYGERVHGWYGLSY